jgi:hypothetical protein
MSTFSFCAAINSPPSIWLAFWRTVVGEDVNWM